MEKKILWIISILLTVILLIEIDFFTSNPTGIEKKETAKSINDQEPQDIQTSEEDISPYEKDYFLSHPIQKTAPIFTNIKDTKERKTAFFNYLKPFIDEKNILILQDRKKITALLNSKETLSAADKEWLSTLRKYHKFKKPKSYSKDDMRALMNRLDIIPASLALSQAANESAWGTSRFATKGNNFYGQWCFSKGCGLVPESRDSGASHEVRKFHDARESVFAYIDNLNSNSAYKKLRELRLQLRENNNTITGLILADGLIHYSQRGEAYVDEIKDLINYNKLWQFNSF